MNPKVRLKRTCSSADEARRQLVAAEFVRVANKPPYQHQAAAAQYFAARGRLDGCEIDLLFTPTEMRRAARRALMNREDIPAARHATLWERIIALFSDR